MIVAANHLRARQRHHESLCEQSNAGLYVLIRAPSSKQSRWAKIVTDVAFETGKAQFQFFQLRKDIDHSKLLKGVVRGEGAMQKEYLHLWHGRQQLLVAVFIRHQLAIKPFIVAWRKATSQIEGSKL